MMKEFGRRRRLILEQIKYVPGLKLENNPCGAFYVFPKITMPGITSAQLADYLLEKAGVAPSSTERVWARRQRSHTSRVLLFV